jgi:hypothetical protein
LTSSETTLLTGASSRRLIAGWTYSRQMLRLKWLAAAIDMIAAGTSAPTAMAAKATPAAWFCKSWLALAFSAR